MILLINIRPVGGVTGMDCPFFHCLLVCVCVCVCRTERDSTAAMDAMLVESVSEVRNMTSF